MESMSGRPPEREGAMKLESMCFWQSPAMPRFLLHSERKTKVQVYYTLSIRRLASNPHLLPLVVNAFKGRSRTHYMQIDGRTLVNNACFIVVITV